MQRTPATRELDAGPIGGQVQRSELTPARATQAEAAINRGRIKLSMREVAHYPEPAEA